ncbi:MAG TPA: 3-(cis-5,6-dihydroxycyclohexa-1,3-dien-1-yl)propanoate dehydrogenase [Stellaceae bacterium]|nr:3-(cis-5,6-dihydroxycyclohexa-1,3-dien-1-yl)propanoate dehydrogenase [Stellaceae bacterium]
MGWLDGQVALVTGGGSGIGRAVVERYIAEGARVAAMDRVSGRGEELRARLGDKVMAIAGDVARLDDNQRAVAQTVATFGRLDVFVGNAGVLDGFMTLRDMPEERLAAACDELFAVNVKGCILGAKAAMAELVKSHGCMIFTASGAGFTSAGGGVIYTASKHAVIGIVRQLSVELGPQIRVNGVAPGGTMTDLRSVAALQLEDRSQFDLPGAAERIAAGNPLQLAMEPDDLAGAYVFLASRANARGITGSIVSVDAGSTLRMMRRS